jgi:hypothetical protein
LIVIAVMVKRGGVTKNGRKISMLSPKEFLTQVAAKITGGNRSEAIATIFATEQYVATELFGTAEPGSRGRGRPPKEETAAAIGSKQTKGGTSAPPLYQVPRLISQRYPAGATREQVMILAGWKTGGANANLARLRKEGLVTVNEGIWRVTEEGVRRATEAPPTQRAA